MWLERVMNMLYHCLPSSCTAVSQHWGSWTMHWGTGLCLPTWLCACVLVSHCLQSVTVQKGEMAQGKAGLALGGHHHWDQLCRAHSWGWGRAAQKNSKWLLGYVLPEYRENKRIMRQPNKGEKWIREGRGKCSKNTVIHEPHQQQQFMQKRGLQDGWTSVEKDRPNLFRVLNKKTKRKKTPNKKKIKAARGEIRKREKISASTKWEVSALWSFPKKGRSGKEGEKTTNNDKRVLTNKCDTDCCPVIFLKVCC